MANSKLSLLFLSLAITLVSCSGSVLGPGTETELATEAEPSCGFVQNSYGQRVSWKSRRPVRFFLDSKASSEFGRALRDAAKVWENHLGFPIIQFENQEANSSMKSTSDGKDLISIESDWPDNLARHQAITNLRWKNNQLVEADIRLNAKYFDFYVDTNQGWGKIHFTSLLVHEFGHALGLAHNEILPTVMWPTLPSATERVTLSSKDQENIKCEY